MGDPVMRQDYFTGFLNFDVGTGNPGSFCGLGVDFFSARFTQTVNFSPGTYRFSVTGDDGVRFYIVGQLKINAWVIQAPNTYKVDVPLTAVNHVPVLEYFDNTSGALARVSRTPVFGRRLNRLRFIPNYI